MYARLLFAPQNALLFGEIRVYREEGKLLVQGARVLVHQAVVYD